MKDELRDEHKDERQDEKRFKKLMKRSEKINKYLHFTPEEIEFLGKYDLKRFQKKFPAEAEEFMSW